MIQKALLIIAISLMTLPSQARKVRKVSAHQKKTSVQQLWVKGAETVVRLKTAPVSGESVCKSFDVLLGEELTYKIECDGQSLSQTLDLHLNSGYTVTRNQSHTTITKYNYLIKKPQVSRFEQSTIKIPYVEEIIHLKRGSEGQMSFYYESFKVDEFGRIVQDNYIQAHSLSSKRMKISSN